MLAPRPPNPKNIPAELFIAKPPAATAEPTAEVELFLSCRNLKQAIYCRRWTYKLVVVSTKTVTDTDWKEVCRLKSANKLLNPIFTTKIRMSYNFEVLQLMQFTVYNLSSNSESDEESHLFMGTCETTLGHIVSSLSVTIPLLNRLLTIDTEQILVVRSKEIAECRDEVTLHFNGINLEPKGMMAKLFSKFSKKEYSFLEISKTRDSGPSQLIYRSEVVSWTNHHPNWEPVTVPARSLCGTDYNRPIKLTCYHYKSHGQHSVIGEFYTTINRLKKGPGPDNDYKCVKAHSTDIYGYVRLNHFQLKSKATFLDYMVNKAKISCEFVIDFNESNGDPDLFSSLHCSHMTNHYQVSFSSTGEILQDYGEDKMIPAMGFGALIPPDDSPSDIFPLTLDPDNPRCEGIEGVASAYRGCLGKIKLNNSSKLSPAIKHVAEIVKNYQSKLNYCVLCIITNGHIDDAAEAKKALIQASSLPMSVVIIGIGNKDFTELKMWDADTQKDRDDREFRNIQFIRFNDFKIKDTYLERFDVEKLNVAKHALGSIPSHFLGYMNAKNIGLNGQIMP